MSEYGSGRWTEFAWGSPCAKGLSIGLFIAGRTFKRNDPIIWQWAIRSTSGPPRRVVVAHDLDTRFRYCLEVFCVGDVIPAREFPPDETTPTTSGLARTVDLVKNVPVKIETNHARIGAVLGTGKYCLRVRFGGDGFDFECISGVIRIVVE